jgi:hypothetical protein
MRPKEMPHEKTARAIRQLGAREAKQKLAEMVPVKKAKKGRKAGKKAR